MRLVADTPFRQGGFSGRVVADVRVRLRRDRALERALLAGGVIITRQGTPGSSVGS